MAELFGLLLPASLSCHAPKISPLLLLPSSALQLACVGTHSWGRAALSALGAVVLPCEGGEGRAWLQDVRFDSGGELLVAASSEGLLSVHSSVHLQSLASAAVAARARGAAAGPAYSDPLLLLDCGMSWLHAVRWNPANENVVGVTSTASQQLPLYDLEHTQVRCGQRWVLHVAVQRPVCCVSEPASLRQSAHG